MKRDNVRYAVRVLGLLVSWGTVAAAQSMAGGNRAATWAVAPAFESYRFQAADRVGIQGISLLSVPIAGRVVLHPRVSAEVSGAWASGTVSEPGGRSRTLSGLTDATVQLQGTLLEDRVSVVIVAAAPTGVATHDSAQAVVAGVMAADLLPFRVMTWGAGGGLGAQLLVTQRMGRTGLGFSTGIRRAGDFEPVAADPFVYRPGLETSARVAVDHDLTGGGKLSVSAGVQAFGDDQVDGRNLFRSGARVTAIGTLGVPMAGGGSAALYGGVLHRSNGSFLDATQPASPAQDLLLAGGVLRRPLGRGVVSPRADLRLFRSADGVGQGYLASVGLGYERRGQTTVLAPVLTARVGQVTVREGAQSGLIGLDLGLSIRFLKGAR